MKNKLLLITLVVIMFLSICTTVYAEEWKLDSADLVYQDYFRDQLKSSLQITDEARLQMKNRYSLREVDKICFNDIDDHWGREEIRLAYYWGLANGFPDGSFAPNSHTTGTQSVLMVRNMIGCFKDIDYQEEVAGLEIDWDLVPLWAVEAFEEETTGQIALMSRNYGNENISRLDFSLMLANSLNLVSMPYDEDVVFYVDQDQISPDDLGLVLSLREMGLVSGSYGRFYPDREITRAEVVVILNRVVALADESSSDDEGSSDDDCGG